MKLTAGQAAKAVSVSTATITRSIKRGSISAEKSEDGAWQIDAAELLRVYPSATLQDAHTLAMKSDAIPLKTNDLRLDVVRLEERLRSAEALKVMADEMRETAERDRDAWRAQAERLTQSLPAPPVASAPPKRQAWWPWRRSS